MVSADTARDGPPGGESELRQKWEHTGAKDHDVELTTVGRVSRMPRELSGLWGPTAADIVDPLFQLGERML